MTNGKKFRIEPEKVGWEWVEKAGKNYQTPVNENFEKLITIIQACRSRAPKTKIVGERLNR